MFSSLFTRVPKGLEDVSKYPYLFAALLESDKWTEEDIAKLAGRNLIRVFKEVEEVSSYSKFYVFFPTYLAVRFYSFLIFYFYGYNREINRFGTLNLCGMISKRFFFKGFFLLILRVLKCWVLELLTYVYHSFFSITCEWW